MSKKDDILQATLNLIGEYGLQAVTLEKIRREANVGSGTIYNYFPDKNSIVIALYDYIVAHISEYIQFESEDGDSVYEMFAKTSEKLISFIENFPKEIDFIEKYSRVPYIAEHASENENLGYKAFIEIIKKGQKQGIIKIMDPVMCAHIVYGIIIYGINGAVAGMYKLNELTRINVVNASWCSIKM